MSVLPYWVMALLMLGAINSENSTLDSCGLEPWGSGAGLWGSLLEEWATAPNTDRQGRIMALPPAQGYYVTDRVDRPPPPPHRRPPGAPAHPPYGPAPPHPHETPYPYDEWQASPPPPPGPGKIVNRPSNPYKDKLKPNYQSPPPQQQIPTLGSPNPHRGPGLAGAPGSPPGPGHSLGSGPSFGPGPGPVDRVDEPPRKQVSETDLYLLSAIEKLVYRVDLMEKRLRKMEENMHYLVAGTQNKPEPCVANFTRVGSACYHWAETAADWKSANLQCRKLRANLLELESEDERRHLLAAMLADNRIRGVDVWTGGLNPGLLWIWAHSARPVLGNTTAAGGAHDATTTIVGEGRCLALVHDPARNTYVYRGQDCALRHRFICEKEEDKSNLSNEIERVARELRVGPAGGAGAGGGARRGRDVWSERDD